MKQNELKPPLGAKHKRKRVGRGDGSGHGTYSGRGCKGRNLVLEVACASGSKVANYLL